MTPDKQFLASLHRITSCRQLGTLNLTIWNSTIEARHIIFDEMHVLGKWPLPAPGQQGKYCTCMAAACRRLADELLTWAQEYDHGNDVLNEQYDTVHAAFLKRLEQQK